MKMRNMNDDNDIKQTVLELCVSIALFVGIIMMCVFYSYFVNASANKEYNHGVCECGGHLILDDRVGHRGTTDFYYHCDRCGVTKVIEANKQPE